jgi:hypothetical protein
MYISSSISLLKKTVLTSLYLINHLLAVAYAISVRAPIGNITDVYI